MVSDDEAVPPNPEGQRAVLRLREIARLLGRPLSDFFITQDAEGSAPTDGDQPAPTDRKSDE